jgi:hypothetical protein
LNWQLIFQIAGYITAVMTIAGFIVVIVKGIKAVYKFARKIETKIDNFDSNLMENTLSTLRLVIINEKMPLSERLKARC